ncbi:T9SS type A sorting domain-containing protein [uncultured Polaribacter sp.]|uniref:T9SS type A sorting domain-containing protein n=1 Tax=uncultured Polaribacter sp. TaxID=174711 RepID=UPI00261E992B|nr:T9SS type A sorting domain-containing protein [uncultured Polaribacter sp.]
MKKITLLILLLSTAIGYSQKAPVNFETGGEGTTWNWVVNDNDSNPALEIVANPNTTGINTSATVAKFTALTTGNPWALVISEDIGSFTFDNTNSLVKLMVRKDVTTDVGVKLEGDGGVAKEIRATTTIINGEWEELTFNFQTEIGVTYNKLVIIPDFLARTQDNIIYFDNLTFNAQEGDSNPYNLEPIDFESNGFGKYFTWTIDQNDSNPALEFVENPNKAGINSSETCAKFTAKAAGNPWALTFTDIPNFIFDDTNNQVKIMVRKMIATDVGIKFEGPAGVNKEIKVANTISNGDWEELTFDFSSENGKTYNRIVLIPDFLERSQDNVLYFDTITFNAKDNEEQSSNDNNIVTIDPAVAWKGYITVFDTSGGYQFGSEWGFADVKTSFDGSSIVLQPNFNAYANALGGADGDRAFWTNSTDGGVTAGAKGNKIMEASSFVEPGETFNGKDLTFTGKIVANTLSEAYTGKFFIKALDPNNGFADVFNGSKVLDLPTSGAFTIAATGDELAAGLIIQYGFVINGLNANPAEETSLGSIVIEANTLSTANVQKALFTSYPNPTRNSWTINTADTKIKSVEVYNLLGKKVATVKGNTNTAIVDASNLSTGIYMAIINSEKGTSSLKLIKE